MKKWEITYKPANDPTSPLRVTIGPIDADTAHSAHLAGHRLLCDIDVPHIWYCVKVAELVML